MPIAALGRPGPKGAAAVAEKWGAEVADRGFAQVPTYLLLLNSYLDDDSKLGPIELLVLVQLVGAWWKKDDMPFPSMATLAKRCGVSSRQIQRSLNSLENKGLIEKEKRRRSGFIATNSYNMNKTAEFLQKVAKHFPADNFKRSSSKVVQESE